jgi:tetratricopeptide (TPR) repeat protein
MSNLASVFEARGELHEAASRYREALALRRTVVGDDHPAVARDRVELGRTLLALGQPAEAVPQLREAARIHEIRSAPPRGVATTLFLLAQAEHAAGDEAVAREHALQAEQWFEQAASPDEAAEVAAWLDARRRIRSATD